MTIVPDLSDINLDCEGQKTIELLANHFEAMARYAWAKSEAMLCRSEGDITAALQCEARCEVIYKLLPPNWRW